MRQLFSKFLQKPFVLFRQSSWKVKILVITIILAAGFIIGRKITAGKKDGFVFGSVTKQTITEIVSESGEVTTNGRVDMYSPTNGIINKVYVDNGEMVTEGQKLFSVKSTATAQQKAAAWAAFQAAKAAVQQAENNRRSTTATVDRVHDDLKDKKDTETFTEKETRTTAEVAHDNAYDALLAAQAGLTSAQEAYQSTQNSTVTAPLPGMVLNLAVASGSGVTVYNALAPDPPVLIITSLGPTEIEISVGESDINKIGVGQPASIRLDAVINKIYQGKVIRFDQSGSITGGVVKFNVYIEITDADDNIKPGMTADVDIITNKIENTIAVPNIAVKPYQKGRAVRILGTDGKIEFIPVKIGIKGKEYTQITEGLNEGQEIITSLTNEKVERANPFGF